MWEAAAARERVPDSSGPPCTAQHRSCASRITCVTPQLATPLEGGIETNRGARMFLGDDVQPMPVLCMLDIATLHATAVWACMSKEPFICKSTLPCAIVDILEPLDGVSRATFRRASGHMAMHRTGCGVALAAWLCRTLRLQARAWRLQSLVVCTMRRCRGRCILLRELVAGCPQSLQQRQGVATAA